MRVAGLLLVALVAAVPAAAQETRFQGIGDLPGGLFNSAALDVSADGAVVVGFSSGGEFQDPQAVRWEDGVLTALPDQGNEFSYAEGITADGQLIAGSTSPNDLFFTTTAVVWSGGGFADIGAPPDHNHGSWARAVSANTGVVVGNSRKYVGGQKYEYYAWRWNGGFSLLGDLPGGRVQAEANAISDDGTVVVGWSSAAGGQEAVRWAGTAESLAGFPGDVVPFEARGVSADGSVVVGQGVHPEARPMAFRWADGRNTAIGIYQGQPINSVAQDVSGDGSIVVGYGEIVGAFIWTEADGIRSLKTVLQDDYGVDLRGWSLSEARAITADGRVVVGQAVNPDGNIEGFRAVLGPVPETALVVNDRRDLADADLDDGRCDVDLAADDNQCTLRAAIQTSNRRPGSDPNLVTFEIDGAGPHIIAVPTMFEQIVVPITIDATTQPGYGGTPVVTLQGSGTFGLTVSAGQTTFRGLAIVGFDTGIFMGGRGGNVVEACHIGVNAAGTAAAANGTGIRISGTADHRVGGETPAQRNVISGNTGRGVWVSGEGAAGVVVAGNHIGTNAAGTAALGNGTEGVFVDGAPGVTVGGTAAGARNVIAGNGADGVRVAGAGAAGTVVAGNYIGTDAGGTVDLGNGGHGVAVVGTADVTVGGTAGTAGAAPGNVIAGNARDGVRIEGTAEAVADGAVVRGNLVGLTANGTAALANDSSGVRVRGWAAGVVVGGEGASARNVVAGNGQRGIWLEDWAGGAPADGTIAANHVGVDRAGGAVVANGGTGILVGRVGDLLANIGVPGAAIRDNLVAGQPVEVGVYGTRSRGARVAANRIGLLADGRAARRGTDEGIGLQVLGAPGAVVGDVGAGNVIGGLDIGVILAADSSVVVANRIGTAPDGRTPRPNFAGLWVPGRIEDDGATVLAATGRKNVIGLGVLTDLPTEDVANIVSANAGPGIIIGPTLFLGGGEAAAVDVAPAAAASPEGAAEAPAALAPAMLRDPRTVGRPATSPRQAARDAGAEAPTAARDQRRLDLAAADSNVVLGNYAGVGAGLIGGIGNGRSDDPELQRGGIEIVRGTGNSVLYNVVGDNGYGIAVYGQPGEPKPTGTQVAGNVIGVTGRGAPYTERPNQLDGVLVTLRAQRTDVLGNTVLFNGGNGVGVSLSPGDAEGAEFFTRIRGNRFFDNDGLGIRIRQGDAEGGAIDGVPEVPRLYFAAVSENEESAAVRGTVREAALVDVYASPRCDPSGAGEGAVDAGALEAAAGVPFVATFDLTDLGDVAVGSYITTTATVGADDGAATSMFSVCARLAAPDDVAEVRVEDGATGPLLDANGLEVVVTDNPPPGRAGGGTAPRRAAGTLYAARYDLAPDANAFAGSARSEDGSTITPDAVAAARYWTLTRDGLEGITYTACLDLTGIAGLRTPERLVLLQRPDHGTPWTPFASTLDGGGTSLCAGGLTAFGDLGIGGDSLSIPTLTEPGPGDGADEAPMPAGLALAPAHPNPFRAATTLSLDVPRGGHVAVRVYDLLGREVAVLHDGPLPAGSHRLIFDGQGLPSGIYAVRAVAGDRVTTRPVTRLR